jgi:hypothetical protein
MKIKFLSLVFFLLFCHSGFSQFLVNQGQIIIPSGYLVIQGNYQNQLSGNINLDGTIQITGNWTNNAANTIMSPTNGTGTVVFNGSTLQTIGGSSTDSLNFEGITINAGASVQVQPGMGITAFGPCTFNTPLILKSSITGYRPKMATFINNSTVTGNISMEFSYTSNGIVAAGGHGQFISSPISNANSSLFGAYNVDSNRIYSWNIATKYIPLKISTSLSVMYGYLYRATSTKVFSFTGPPNANSSYSVSGFTRPVGTDGFFLTGNPYPAVIDYQTFYKKATNLTTTFYVRCVTIGGIMVVDTWNGSAKTGVNPSGAILDGKIAPLQGFWVQISAQGLTGTLAIANSDRGHNWGSSPYLKSGDISDKDIFRLGIYSGIYKDESVIIQSDSAADEFENWDSQKLFLNDAHTPEIFTLSPEGIKLVIQSVKPISQEKLFPLGMNIGTAGSFQFKADLSQTNEQYEYTLEDKQLNVFQNLRTTPVYSFSSGIVNDSLGSRFVLHFNLVQSQSAGMLNQINSSTIVGPQIYSYGNDIYIRNCEIHARLIIYNILGSQVYNSQTHSDEETITLSSAPGIYLVKLSNGSEWKTQKVLLK